MNTPNWSHGTTALNLELGPKTYRTPGPNSGGTVKRSHFITFAVLVLAIIGLAIWGCAIAQAPMKSMPHVVVMPTNGQLTVSSELGKPIGDVLPIYVSIANGTNSPHAIVPSQIFALDDAGSRIAPLPPAEAARQAGGAGELHYSAQVPVLQSKAPLEQASAQSPDR